jgi:hypothetical protein
MGAYSEKSVNKTDSFAPIVVLALFNDFGQNNAKAKYTDS